MGSILSQDSERNEDTIVFVLIIPKVIGIYMSEWVVVALLLNLIGTSLYKKKILYTTISLKTRRFSVDDSAKYLR